jgi:hypothetical protein
VDQASLAFVLLGLFGANPADSARLASLEERHRQSIASPAGREYETEALRAFRGDATIVGECAPPGSPRPDPVTIWFAIEGDGRVGELAIDPATHVARCIAIRVRGRAFPEPPGPFVARIDLSFAH